MYCGVQVILGEVNIIIKYLHIDIVLAFINILIIILLTTIFN